MLEYEMVPHNKIKGINILVNEIKMRSLHVHYDAELILVINGHGKIRVRDTGFDLSAGDVVLVNSFDPHEFMAIDNSLRVIIVQISNHFLREYYYQVRNTVFLDVLLKPCLGNNYDIFVKDILDLAKHYFTSDTFYEFQCIRALSELLYLINSNSRTTVLTDDEYTRKKRLNLRFNRISAYIETNYQEKITLSDIAKQENLTVTHLSHIFTKYFGMTFQQYLTKKRLEHALRLISDAQLSLTDIALESGFSDLKYMTKAFETTLGITPKEYQNLHRHNLLTNSAMTQLEYIYSEEEAIKLLAELRT